MCKHLSTLLSTSDTAIHFLTKRWTVSVRGQLIVLLDVLEDTTVNAAALLAPSHFLTDNYCQVRVHTPRKEEDVFLIKKRTGVFYLVYFH